MILMINQFISSQKALLKSLPLIQKKITNKMLLKDYKHMIPWVKLSFLRINIEDIILKV